MMPKIFEKISSISPNNNNWEDKTYLTIDVDWAHDEIIKDTIELFEQIDICVTWFMTHKTPMINRIRENPKFELGIHPNFNLLLSGESSRGENAKDILDKIMEIIPEAKSVRSHSMTQSTNLLEFFIKSGLTHDANHFVPYQSKINLKPWALWNGLVKVPYLWEDDIACLFGNMRDIVNVEKQGGLKVFDFHPIHIFLNTEHMTRYEQSREFHNIPESLQEFKNTSVFGTRDALRSILG